jgi:hypothetical protein
MRIPAMRIAAALAFSLVLPTAALAAPTKLSDAQLDLVTAGISATIDANALALGSRAVATTNARTNSFEGRFVSIAFGRGSAFARGTDGAQTSVDGSGEGGRVSTHTRTVSFETPKGAVSGSWGFSFAIEIKHDAMSAVRAAPR